MTLQTPSLASVVGIVSRRLLPLLLVMYIVAFLDRANVSFAKQAWQADTGISDAAFAFGAGVFFLGYALLEIPSNLLLHRFGARRWLCRIMVTWGVASAAMAWATTPQVFYALRFALGVAEAGFFPGIILYLTYWFPEHYRARAMGVFYFGAPLAFILGSPLSGALLELDGLAHWQGWQWMFLIEGLLAIGVGLLALAWLDDRPQAARWLSAPAKAVLAGALARDTPQHSHTSNSLLRLLMHPRLVFLCLLYGLIQASVYGVVFYMPAQIAQAMGSQMGWKVGMVAALPWLGAMLCTWAVCRLADRSGQYHHLAALCLAVAALGMFAASQALPAAATVAALGVAAAGFIAVQPLFWTFPARLLGGRAAAAGIALVNSVGALGGFLAPNIRQWADSHFSTAHAGLLMLAGMTLSTALLAGLLKRVSHRPSSATASGLLARH